MIFALVIALIVIANVGFVLAVLYLKRDEEDGQTP